jgi:hypothetical protein
VNAIDDVTTVKTSEQKHPNEKFREKFSGRQDTTELTKTRALTVAD